MDIKKLTEPLDISEIDFRIQSINRAGYATILAYKDARVDIKRLNEACGPLGWERMHTRDNRNCIVRIWDDERKHWVGKEDTGVESMASAEKGLASDSFKRACFNWGIGLELYDYPVISIKLNGGDNKNQEWFFSETKKNRDGKATPQQGWGLKLKQWQWHTIFKDGLLVYLACKDEQKKLRFSYDIREAK